jgi:hypothetical protein
MDTSTLHPSPAESVLGTDWKFKDIRVLGTFQQYDGSVTLFRDNGFKEVHHWRAVPKNPDEWNKAAPTDGSSRPFVEFVIKGDGAIVNRRVVPQPSQHPFHLDGMVNMCIKKGITAYLNTHRDKLKKSGLYNSLEVALPEIPRDKQKMSKVIQHVSTQTDRQGSSPASPPAPAEVVQRFVSVPPPAPLPLSGETLSSIHVELSARPQTPPPPSLNSVPIRETQPLFTREKGTPVPGPSKNPPRVKVVEQRPAAVEKVLPPPKQAETSPVETYNEQVGTRKIHMKTNPVVERLVKEGCSLGGINEGDLKTGTTRAHSALRNAICLVMYDLKVPTEDIKGALGFSGSSTLASAHNRAARQVEKDPKFSTLVQSLRDAAAGKSAKRTRPAASEERVTRSGRTASSSSDESVSDELQGEGDLITYTLWNLDGLTAPELAKRMGKDTTEVQLAIARVSDRIKLDTSGKLARFVEQVGKVIALK